MKAAITIDVDSLRLYHDIHGLPGPEPGRDPIYTHALPRFWELLDGRCATLFLIGADAAEYAEAFAPVVATGCEVASHSHDHDYRLTRQPPEAIAENLARAEAALAPLNGGRPIRGFRAPGYNVSPVLLQTLVDRGYAYDSSLLPAPTYYAARAAALALYRARGRPSRSLAGDPRAFAGPVAPYRTRPEAYWRADDGGALLEIPMAVEPTSRLPLIGTSWVLWPAWLRERLLRRTLQGSAPFVFEMHAMDLLDPDDPGVHPRLVRAQPDLRRAAATKLAALRALVRQVEAAADWTTLGEISG